VDAAVVADSDEGDSGTGGSPTTTISEDASVEPNTVRRGRREGGEDIFSSVQKEQRFEVGGPNQSLKLFKYS
jgi:hypothetical protein